MILNARFNNFSLIFNKGFVPTEVREKYKNIMKSLFFNFKSIEDFLSWTVQSISMPGFQLETVQQFKKNNYTVYKGGWDQGIYIVKNYEIGFLLVESFVNYFIVRDCIEYHFRLFEEKKRTKEYFDDTFLSPIYLLVLDSEGFIKIIYIFREVTFTGISTLNLSFASNVPQYTSFTLSFNCNYVDVITEKYDIEKVIEKNLHNEIISRE